MRSKVSDRKWNGQNNCASSQILLLTENLQGEIPPCFPPGLLYCRKDLKENNRWMSSLPDPVTLDSFRGSITMARASLDKAAVATLTSGLLLRMSLDSATPNAPQRNDILASVTD